MIYIVMRVFRSYNHTPYKAFDTYDEAMAYIESIAHKVVLEDEEEIYDYMDDKGNTWYVQPVERG